MQDTYSTKTDEEFSRDLLQHSKLRQIKYIAEDFAGITRAFGSLIEDQNKNCFYDTRSYFYKPEWGHNLPILVRYKNIDIQKIYHEFKTNNLKDNTINDQLEKYYKVVLKEGGRIANIEKQISNTFKETNISVDSLMISFPYLDKDKVFRESLQSCLLINDKNFFDDKVHYYLTHAITDEQLNDCLSKIKNIYQGSLCS